MTGEFTSQFVTPLLGAENIGWVMLAFGICDALGSFVLGSLSDCGRFARMGVILTGACVQGAALLPRSQPVANRLPLRCFPTSPLRPSLTLPWARANYSSNIRRVAPFSPPTLHPTPKISPKTPGLATLPAGQLPPGRVGRQVTGARFLDFDSQTLPRSPLSSLLPLHLTRPISHYQLNTRLTSPK